MAELPLYFVAYILLRKRLAASTQEDHLITEILTSGTSHDMKAQLDSMRYA